ncbi:hypothetical protein DFP73DRAFT_555112, partial [Morchella snyderi]
MYVCMYVCMYVQYKVLLLSLGRPKPRNSLATRTGCIAAQYRGAGLKEWRVHVATCMYSGVGSWGGGWWMVDAGIGALQVVAGRLVFALHVGACAGCWALGGGVLSWSGASL